MATIPRMIGESSETQMLKIISKQLDRLTKVIYQSGLTITTTTTTVP